MLFTLVIAFSTLIASNDGARDWEIQIAGSNIPDKNANDCPYLAQLCESTPCNNIKPTLPTESLYDAQGKLKIKFTTIIENTKPDEKILCVDQEWFMNTEIGYVMTAITGDVAGSFSAVELKKMESVGDNKWKIKTYEHSREEHKGLCEHLRKSGCDKDLDSCLGPGEQQNLPFFKTDPDNEEFKRYRKCNDEGKINGFECEQTMCSIHGGAEHEHHKDKTKVLESFAIVKCESKTFPHAIYYDQEQHQWCLSKYSEPTIAKGAEGSAEIQTLSEFLIDNVPAEKAEDYKTSIFRSWKPWVVSIKYAGDVQMELQKRKYAPFYSQIEPWQGKTLNAIVTDISKDGTVKSNLEKMFQCNFGADAAKTISCDKMVFNDWAVFNYILEFLMTQQTQTQTQTQSAQPTANTATQTPPAQTPAQPQSGGNNKGNQEQNSSKNKAKRRLLFDMFGDANNDNDNGQIESESEQNTATVDTQIKLIVTASTMIVAAVVTAASFFAFSKSHIK